MFTQELKPQDQMMLEIDKCSKESFLLNWGNRILKFII